jgi:hypothetical protein
VATVTEPRRNAPSCPSCRAEVGDPWCYTATGFRRHHHETRRKLAAGQPPAASTKGSKSDAMPTQAQQRMLSSAVDGGGLVEVSGYQFHGDAQRRATMAAMVADTRGWFRYVRDTPHAAVYEITDQGRLAYYRHVERWGTAR